MMNQSRESREEALFRKAIELPTSVSRTAFLDETCAGNAALRTMLELLLEGHFQGEGFLTCLPARSPIPQQPPGIDGRFQLLEKIGEGGFGEVWRAEQLEPVRRFVAVKILKAGMDTRQVVARFEAERQALALMDHTNIAKVFDAGSTQAGRPYFVMELVQGAKITEYCKQHGLGLKDRLQLFILVCQAIQHAHQKGIIHRDIKPSNVLVSLQDVLPVPKVIDFGIAKATQQPLTDKTVVTQFQQFLGTPAYISPEQALLTSEDIDTRSDIYSLGALLYELLTGKPPFDNQELLTVGLDEMRRIIREREPLRPSAAAGSTAPATVDPDLDWITMTCLEKDRTRRYPTANALAADLQRYLNHEPVTARPPSAVYRMQKAVRRNRLAYGAAAAVAAALITGAIVSYRQAVRARAAENLANARLTEVGAERDAKEQARENAEQISRYLQQIFQSPDPTRDGRTVTVAETLERATGRLDSDFANQPERKARLQATIAETYVALGVFPPAVQLWREVQAYWLKAKGADHEESLKAGGSLAEMLQATGQLQEALQLGESLLGPTTKLYGRQSTNTARLITVRANVLDLLGRLPQARELREEALATYRQILGPGHRETLKAMNNLGSSYYQLGMKEKSLANQEELAELSRTALGEEDPVTLANVSNVGVDYNNFGRYEEAVRLLEPTLVRMRKVLGPNHPNTLFTMQHLGQSFYGLRRWKEALELRQELQELSFSVLGQEHPDMVHRSRALADSYLATDRIEEALKYYEVALALSRKLYGPKHREVVPILAGLANAYKIGQRDAEALATAQEALDMGLELYGPEHPGILSIVDMKADLYAARGKWAEARTELSRLLSFKKFPDRAHLTFLRLAALEVHLNQTEYYEALRKLLLERFGQANSAQIANRIAKACLLVPVEGEELKSAMALAARGVELGEQDPGLYRYLAADALARYRAGDYSGAAARAERSLSLSGDDNGAAGKGLAQLMLAMAFHKLNRLADASTALAKGEEIVEQLPRLETGSEGNWHDVMIARILLREARREIQ